MLEDTGIRIIIEKLWVVEQKDNSSQEADFQSRFACCFWQATNSSKSLSDSLSRIDCIS
jgi:hypothetical protein